MNIKIIVKYFSQHDTSHDTHSTRFEIKINNIKERNEPGDISRYKIQTINKDHLVAGRYLEELDLLEPNKTKTRRSFYSFSFYRRQKLPNSLVN